MLQEGGGEGLLENLGLRLIADGGKKGFLRKGSNVLSGS